MNENMQPNNVPTNQMPNNTQSNMPSGMQNSEHENKSSIGSIIGTIIVIAIIILGGLYFWGKRVEEAKMKQELVSESTGTTVEESNENMEANAIKSMSSSDDLNSIDRDLKATNTTNLGAELQ